MPKIKSDGNPVLQLEQIKKEIDNHNAEIKAQFGLTGCATVILQKRSNTSANLLIKFTYSVDRNGIAKNKQEPLAGFGSAFSVVSRQKAFEASRRITQALKFNQFSKSPVDFWEWLDYDVMGKPKPGLQAHNIGDLIDSYKIYWIKVNSDIKYPDKRYHGIRGQFLQLLPRDKELTPGIIKDFIFSLPDNSSLKRTITAIKDLLTHHQIYDQFSAIINSRKISGKEKKELSDFVPSDEQIMNVFDFGFSFFRKDGKRKRKELIDTVSSYRFIYGIMATYGIRAHEFFHIMNWYNPVDISSNDWITVDDDSDNDGNEEYKLAQYQSGCDRVIPAFFDPNNQDKILVIGDDTKTGKRLAIPISPKGENWLERFNLLDGLKLPNIKDPMKAEPNGNIRGATHICQRLGRGKESTIRWDLVKCPKFSSHKLRHAYTHRGRCLGYNPWKLSQAQGHTLSTADNSYSKNYQGQRTKEMLLEEMKRVKSESQPLLTYDEAILRVVDIVNNNDDKTSVAMAIINEIYGIKQKSNQLKNADR